MLQAEALDITYTGKTEVYAVRGVSFTVIPGQTTTLFGQSGSGKTAITLALLGLLPENARYQGKITWVSPEGNKIDLSALPEKERKEWVGKNIGWVSQGAQRALSPTRTIGSLLREAIKVNGNLAHTEARTEIKGLISALGLPKSVLKAFPDQLSGGQRQRCLLALALINRPKILIADEPTTSLDVLNEHRLLHLLQKIQIKRNIGIIFITHDLRITRDFVGPCYYMEQGKFKKKAGSVLELMDSLMDSIESISPDESIPSSLQVNPSGSSILTADQFSVTYGSQGGVFSNMKPVKAVSQVNLVLSRGESLGIIGASGSGKSSLAKAVAGVLPFEGEIIWGDNLPANSIRVQLILQDSYSSLHPRFTVEKSLREVIRIHTPGLPKAETKAAALSYLAQVQLSDDYLSRFPHQLSGGERQRVSLARSLAANPELLIMDESISSLDFELQRKMIKLIRSLKKTHKLSLIVISHDIRVVRNLCQRVIVMESGKIVEDGETRSLIEQPQHSQTIALIEAAGLSHD